MRVQSFGALAIGAVERMVEYVCLVSCAFVRVPLLMWPTRVAT